MIRKILVAFALVAAGTLGPGWLAAHEGHGHGPQVSPAPAGTPSVDPVPGPVPRPARGRVAPSDGRVVPAPGARHSPAGTRDVALALEQLEVAARSAQSALQRFASDPLTPRPGGLRYEPLGRDVGPSSAGPSLTEFLRQVRGMKGVAAGPRGRAELNGGLDRLWLLADDVDDRLLEMDRVAPSASTRAALEEARASWRNACRWLKELRVAIRGGLRHDLHVPDERPGADADI